MGVTGGSTTMGRGLQRGVCRDAAHGNAHCGTNGGGLKRVRGREALECRKIHVARAILQCGGVARNYEELKNC